MGSLALLMLQHLSGGQWGLLGRRVFEAASRNLPVVILFFIPLLFRLPSVYHWAAPDVTTHDVILQKKAGYLNVPFFIGRAVLYFAVWMLCTFLLNRYSAAQDRGEAGIDPADTRQARVVSAPGLLVYALTISFATVDWVMSIDAHWYSTIFGLLFMVGQGLTAFAFVIAILALLGRDRADRLVRHVTALPRLRQADVRLRDAVGLPGVLAVPDHLGRQPARRNPVVSATGSAARGATSRCCWRSASSCCRSRCCCRAT